MFYKKFIFLLILMFAVLLLKVFSEEATSMEVPTGTGLILLNSTCSFYSDQFIRLNPCVQAISYSENGESIGYVNVFGGIGKNFIVMEGKSYNVSVGENCSFMLPCPQ
jgi:hypothetical protein